MTERAEAVIDLQALRANLDYLGGPACGDARVARMVVVKADAYGHGAPAVARVAREEGIPWLGVALPSEAMELRRAGDRGPILAWLYPPGDPGVAECIEADVDLGVGSPAGLQAVAGAARVRGRRARVHLKVDSGLGRGGCPPAQWPDLVAQCLAESSCIEVVGVWSHLAMADIPHAPETAAQVVAFEAALAQAESLGLVPEIRHLASSGAALSAPETRYDLVRLGIAAYGVAPGPDIPMGSLRPVMTLCATVAAVKPVPAGHGASYGLTWRAPADTTLALVPLGYADGIPRTVRGAQVLIGGRRLPIVGRVAMDQVVVDAGEADVRVGDDVLVWGPGDAGEPTATEWADWDDTIGYEIVTRVGPRVPRRYVEG